MPKDSILRVRASAELRHPEKYVRQAKGVSEVA